jgi:hypothetical protein
MSGLGRIAFVHKKYADAERWYGACLGKRAVARYKATSDHTVLGRVAEELQTTYPLTPISLLTIDRTALGSRARGKLDNERVCGRS